MEDRENVITSKKNIIKKSFVTKKSLASLEVIDCYSEPVAVLGLDIDKARRLESNTEFSYFCALINPFVRPTAGSNKRLHQPRNLFT